MVDNVNVESTESSMQYKSPSMISVPVTRAYHEDDWEILAEVCYDPWSQGRDWTCHLCHRLITKVFGDNSNIITHFWTKHQITPVYIGFRWAGRPKTLKDQYNNISKSTLGEGKDAIHNQ